MEPVEILLKTVKIHSLSIVTKGFFKFASRRKGMVLFQQSVSMKLPPIIFEKFIKNHIQELVL
jgi:hypothetical protein